MEVDCGCVGRVAEGEFTDLKVGWEGFGVESIWGECCICGAGGRR